nr:transmembrane protein, putative [Ipomoea batatas]
MIEGCVNEARMAQWEEMGELFIEEEDIEEPCTEEAEIEELYATNDPIGEEPLPKVELKPLPPNLRYEFLDSNFSFPVIVNASLENDEIKKLLDMTRNKSIAKKPAPKVPQVRGSGTLRFNSAEQRERYQAYMQKPVVPPYVINLDTLEEFGIREEVEALLGEKEWKYILVDFEDAIYPDLVLEVMTTLQVPKTIDLMSTKCISFTVGSIVFQFSPDDLSRYLEIDAMQGLSEEELEQRETDMQENKTEINRDILLSLFKDMRAILGPVGNTRKRARRGAAAQAQDRVEEEEENEEEVGLLNSRMDSLETAVGRLETRNEAHAYQTWLRGQFPPGPQYYYDPAGGPPHYYDPTGGPPHFYSSAGGSQPYYGTAGGSQYYFDPAEGSQPQYDPSRGPQFPYDPTDF